MISDMDLSKVPLHLGSWLFPDIVSAALLLGLRIGQHASRRPRFGSGITHPS